MVTEDHLDDLLGPLVHEHFILLELLELLLIDAVHVLLDQPANYLLLPGLLLGHLPLDLVEQALVFLQALDAAVLEPLFTLFPLLLHFFLQCFQDVPLWLLRLC